MTSAAPLVAVAGGTSKQGRSVVKTLLADGCFRVRALTRDPSSPQARELARLGADVAAAPLEPGHDDEWFAAFTGARNAFLVTPPTHPGNSRECELGCRLADAAVRAGVKHIVFSTLENVDEISGGKLFAPHFTDKARIADHIRTLPVAHTFVMLAFFYTNLLEYYVPRMEDDVLLLPIYLPEDFRAPFVDPLTATGPAVLEILTHPELYQGETLPLVGDIISPREMVETFQRVTGIRAEYRNAFTRDGLLRWFPEFASDELQVKELLGMVNYAVDHGYFRSGRDLEWSRRITPDIFTWERFLRATGWRGKRTSFNAS